jgi:hypothetical protein
MFRHKPRRNGEDRGRTVGSGLGCGPHGFFVRVRGRESGKEGGGKKKKGGGEGGTFENLVTSGLQRKGGREGGEQQGMEKEMSS